MDIDDGGGGLLVDREWREGMLPGTDSTDWDSNPELREIFEAISKDPLQSRSTLSTEPFFLDADEHKSLEPGASGNRKFERPDINQFLRDLGRNLGVASVVGYQDFPYTEGGAARADPFVEREYWLKLSIPGLGGTDGYAILHVHYMGKFYDPNQCAFTGARSTITQINIRHTWNSSQDVSERYNMKCADLDKWRERKGNVVLGPKEAPHGWKWREDSQRKKTWFTSSLRDLLEKGEKCTTVVRKKYVEYMQGAAAVSSRTTFSRSKPLFEEGVRDAGWSGLRLAALCIGVGTYSGSLKLDNPVRDAEALFEAINKFPDCRAAILRDPKDRGTMTDHLCDEFLEKLKALSADKLPDVVALVLAGHGMQHESNVFLIPATAKCDSERKLKEYCLSHMTVLEYMLNVLDSPARQALKEIKFVLIMDMCRVPGEFDLTKTISEPDQNKAPGCWSICYSTSRGSVAADGVPGSHSPLVLGLLDPQSGIFAPGVSLKEGIEHACSVVEQQSGVDTRQSPTDMKLRRLGNFILQPTSVIGRAEGERCADNPEEGAAAKKQRCEGPNEPTSSGLLGASVIIYGKRADSKSVDDDVTKKSRLQDPHAGGGGGGGGGQGQGSGGGCAFSSDSTQQLFPCETQGDVAAILEGMRTHSDNATVQQQACQALANLARDNDGMRVKIEGSSGIVAVVAAMTAHKTSAGVQQMACAALCNLTANDDNLRVAVAAAGGIEAVLAAMKAHKTSTDVQEKACEALRNLAGNSDNQVQVTVAGGIEAVVSAMKAHKTSAGVQEKALAALCNLTVNISDNQVQVKVAGGIEAIVAAIKAHTTIAGVQEMACRALANLAFNPANLVAVAKAGGIEAVLSAMQADKTSALLQEMACGALMNLTVNVENTDVVAAAGGIEVLATAMKTHQSSALLQEYACVALLHLACNGSLERIKAAGGVELAKRAVSASDATANTKDWGKRLLEFLA